MLLFNWNSTYLIRINLFFYLQTTTLVSIVILTLPWLHLSSGLRISACQLCVLLSGSILRLDSYTLLIVQRVPQSSG